MDEVPVRRLAQVGLALFVVLGAVLGERPPVVAVPVAALALLAVALMPRSGGPLLGGALVVAGAVTVLCSSASGNLGWFALCVLVGWCALRGDTWSAVAMTSATLLVFVASAVLSGDASGWGAWVAGTVFTLVVCLMSQRQHELVVELQAAQAGLAERVRGQERLRVARELHDVVAHSLTVSLLHVSSARLVVEDDPAEAADALALAEELGRRSLTEVRHAVGLLREGAGDRAPLPGTEQLTDLVDGFRRAGARVAYDVVGDLARLPATTGLTVYRILQESLTNAVRHGQGTAASVRLEVGDACTVLTVDSGGAPGPDDGRGAGLPGMRERAEALGGELCAGPARSGWRVRAVLPA